jgi:hypothetical protein
MVVGDFGANGTKPRSRLQPAGGFRPEPPCPVSLRPGVPATVSHEPAPDTASMVAQDSADRPIRVTIDCRSQSFEIRARRADHISQRSDPIPLALYRIRQISISFLSAQQTCPGRSIGKRPLRGRRVSGPCPHLRLRAAPPLPRDH